MGNEEEDKKKWREDDDDDDDDEANEANDKCECDDVSVPSF